MTLSKRIVKQVHARLLRLSLSPQPARDFETAMHEWMRSPDTMLSVEPAIVMLEDERWRTAFGRWLWQYFDLPRSPKAGGGHLLVAIPALFDGTLPSDNGEELLSLLSDEPGMLRLPPDSDPHPYRADRIIVSAASQLIPADAFLYGMTPIRPLSIGDTERLVQRWSDLPASTLRVATLFTFVVPCPGLTTVCGTDVPVPASAALDECVQRIQDKVTQVRMAHPDCGLRLLPVERFSQACLSGHLRTGTLAAKAVCHSYLKTRHEQAEKDPRIDVEVETPCRVSLSLTCWSGSATQTADIVFWDARGAGCPVRVEVPLGTSLAELEQAWVQSGADLALPYELIPAARQETEKSSGLRPLQETPGRWVPADLVAGVPQDARSLLNDVHWLRSASAADADVWRDETHWPYPLLYNEGEPVAALRKHFVAPLTERILALSESPGMSFSLMREHIVEEFPAYAGLAPRYTGDVQPTAMPYEFYWSIHFKRAAGRLFSVRNALLERLDWTDIEVGLPLAKLHAPFPDCYLHLETPRELEPEPDETLPLWLRGFFVSEVEEQSSPPARRLALAPIVTAGLNLTSAYSEEIIFTVADTDERDLVTALDALVDEAQAELTDTVKRKIFRQFALCAKILIYIGLRSARLVEHDDRARRLANASGMTGKDRKKALVKASRVTDYIEVGPEKSMAQELADSGRTLSHVFWRRGHFRMQPYGPNWSLRRERWIQPALVNAAHLEGEAAPPLKDYAVR